MIRATEALPKLHEILNNYNYTCKLSTGSIFYEKKVIIIQILTNNRKYLELIGRTTFKIHLLLGELQNIIS